MSSNRRHNRWGTHSGAATSKHNRSGPDRHKPTLQERRDNDSAIQQLAEDRSLIHPAEEALWDEDELKPPCRPARKARLMKRKCLSDNSDCAAGRWDCDACTAEEHHSAGHRLSPRQLAYDAFMESNEPGREQ